MKTFTWGELITGSEEKLGICYMSGRNSLKKERGAPAVRFFIPGSLPNPDHLLILDPETLSSLRQKSHSLKWFLPFYAQRGCFIALSNACKPPREWVAGLEDRDLFLCVSRFDPYLLQSRLSSLVKEKTEETRTLHANLVMIDGKGVLLTGEAGSGKTCCAVALVRKGHGWGADDTVILKKISPTAILGSAHPATKGLLHLRGRGIVSVSECFREVSLVDQAVIHLIAELAADGVVEPIPESVGNMRMIMGVPIRHVRLRREIDGVTAASKILNLVHQGI